MSSQSAKKKRLGSRRRPGNQNEMSKADELHTTGNDAVAQRHIPEENTDSLNVLANPDHSLSETQHPPSPEFTGNRRKLGSSRRNKRGQHVKDSATVSCHSPEEEVEEKTRGKQTSMTTQMSLEIQPERQEELSQASEHDSSETHDGYTAPIPDYSSEAQNSLTTTCTEPDLKSLIPKSETQQADLDENETNSKWVSDTCEFVKTMQGGVDRSDTLHSEEVNESAHLTGNSKFTGLNVPSSTTVDQQLIEQSYSREMPEEKLPDVFSVEKESEERDDNTQMFRQDGNLQGNYLVNESHVESVVMQFSSTPEITTEKNSPQQNTESVCSVGQVTVSSPKEKLLTEEKQDEHFNLSEVKGAHQSVDAVYNVQEQEIKSTEMPHIDYSSESVTQDGTQNSEIMSRNLIDQTEVSDTYQSELIVDRTDSTTNQEISNPDDQQDEQPTKESHFEALQQDNEDHHVYDTKESLISDIERGDPALGQLYEIEGQVEDDVKPSAEQTGHQEKEGLSEMEESESSLQTLQSEINDPYDPQPQQNDNGFHLIGNRRKLGSSRRNRGRQLVKDSAAESYHEPTEDVDGNTRNNEPLETTEMSLTTETAVQEKSMETMLDEIDKFDTAQADNISDQMKENAQVGTLVDSGLPSSSTVDQQMINQSNSLDAPSEELPIVCTVTETESKERDDETELLWQWGISQTNYLVSESHMKSDDVESSITTEITTDQHNPREHTQPEYSVDQATVSSSNEIFNLSVVKVTDQPEEALQQDNEDSHVYDTKEPPISDIVRVDTALGQVYEIEGQVEDDIKPSAEQTGHQEREGLSEMEESESSLQNLQSEIHNPFDSQHQQNDNSFNPIGNRRKLGSSRRNRGRRHVKDDPKEEVVTRENEPHEETEMSLTRETTAQEKSMETMLPRMDEFEPSQTEAAIDQDKENTHVGTLVDSGLPSSSTVDQQMINQSNSLDAPSEELPIVCTVTETESKERDDETELLWQWGISQTNYLVSESHMKSDDVESSITTEITTDKHNPREHTQPEYSVDQATVSSSNEIFNLSVVKVTDQPEEAVTKVPGQEVKPAEMQEVPQMYNSSENVIHDATENFEIMSGNMIDQTDVSDTYQSELIVDRANDSPTNQDISNPDDQHDEHPTEESHFDDLQQDNEYHHVYDTKESLISDIERGDPALGQVYEIEGQVEDDVKPSTEQTDHQEREGLSETEEGESSLQTLQSEINAPFDSQPQDNSAGIEEQTHSSFNPIGNRRKLGSSRRNKGRQQVRDSVAESCREHKEEDVESTRGNETLETAQLLLAIERTNREELSQGSEHDMMPVTHDISLYPAILPGYSSEDRNETETDFKVAVSDTPVEATLEGAERSHSPPSQEVRGAHHSGDAVIKVHEQEIKSAQMQEMSQIDDSSESVILDATENSEIMSANLIDQTEVSDAYQSELIVDSADDSPTNQDISNPDDQQDEQSTKESHFEALQQDNEDHHVYDTKESPISDIEREDTALGQVYEIEGQVEDDVKPSTEQTDNQEREGLSETEEGEFSLRTLQSEINAPFDSQPQDNSAGIEEQTHSSFNPIGNRRKLGSSRRNKGRQQVKDSVAEFCREHKEEDVESTRGNEALETAQLLLAIERTNQEELSQGSEHDMMPVTHDISLYPAIMPGYSSEDRNETETDFKVAVSDTPVEATLEGAERSHSPQSQEVRGAHHSGDAVIKVHEQEIKSAQMQEMSQIDDSSESVILDATENSEIMSANLIDQTEVSDAYQSELIVDSADDSPTNQDISNPDDQQDEQSTKESHFEALQQDNEDHHVYDTKESPISDIEREDTALGQVYEIEGQVEDDVKPSTEQTDNQEREGLSETEEGEFSLRTLQSEINAPFDSQPQDNSAGIEEQTHSSFNPIGNRRKLGSSRRNKGRQQVKDSVAEFCREHKEEDVESTRGNEALETAQLLLAIERTNQEELSQGSEHDMMPVTHDISLYPAIMPGYSSEDRDETETDFKVEVSDTPVEATLEGAERSHSPQSQEVRGAHHSGDAVIKVHEQEIKSAQMQEMSQIDDSSESVILDATENSEIMSANLIDQTEVSDAYQSELIVDSADDSPTNQDISNPEDQHDEHPTEESNFDDLQQDNEYHHVYDTKEPPISDIERVDTALGQVYEIEGQVEDDVKPSTEQTDHQEREGLSEMEESESSLQTLQSEINDAYDSQPQQNDSGFHLIGNRRKLGSSRRNKGRQLVKDSAAESYHEPTEDLDGNTRDNEPHETTEMSLTTETAVQEKSMQEEMDKFDTAQTDDNSDQMKENAQVGTLVGTDLHSSSTVDQQMINQSNSLEEPSEELPIVCTVTETESKERDDETELLRQWGISQTNYLVSESHMKSDDIESSITIEITTDKNNPREHTEPEYSVDQATVSSSNEIFNLSVVKVTDQPEEALQQDNEDSHVYDTKEPPISDIVRVDTALGQVYEIEGRVEDDIKPSAEQTGHQEREGLSEMEESESSLQNLQSEIHNPFDSQHQQNDNSFNPIGNRRKLGSSRRNRGRRHVKDDPKEEVVTRENEPHEETEMSLTIETTAQEKSMETMLPRMDEFEPSQTEAAIDQDKENTHVGTLVGISKLPSVHSSSVVDQQTIDRSNFREMPDKEIPNVCSVTETESKERDDGTEWVRQDGSSPGNYLVSADIESSFTPEINTDKSSPEENTEYGVEQAAFSSPKDELSTNVEQKVHVNLSEVRGARHSEDAVNEEEVKPTKMPEMQQMESTSAEESESSLQTQQSEMNVPTVNSQPLDISQSIKEQIHTGFSPTRSRRKLGSSRRIKGRLHVKDTTEIPLVTEALRQEELKEQRDLDFKPAGEIRQTGSSVNDEENAEISSQNVMDSSTIVTTDITASSGKDNFVRSNKEVNDEENKLIEVPEKDSIQSPEVSVWGDDSDIHRSISSMPSDVLGQEASQVQNREAVSCDKENDIQQTNDTSETVGDVMIKDDNTGAESSMCVQASGQDEDGVQSDDPPKKDHEAITHTELFPTAHNKTDPLALFDIGLEENISAEPAVDVSEERGISSQEKNKLDDSESLQARSNQKRRKLGSTRRTELNRKREEKGVETEDMNSETAMKNLDEKEFVQELPGSVTAEVSQDENAVNLSLSANTKDTTNTDNGKSDEERPESVNATQNQALNAAEVPVVEDLQIMKSVVRGGTGEEHMSAQACTEEPGDEIEGAHNKNLEMKNANLDSTNRRRKMGSTRRNLGSRTKHEDLHQKQEVENEATNVGEVKTEHFSDIIEDELQLKEHKDGSEQRKEKILETVQYSHTGESQENPVSRGQLVETENLPTPNYLPAIPSTSPKHDLMSAGRRRKMGSHRKSRGQQKYENQAAREDRTTDIQNVRDVRGTTDESAIKTTEEQREEPVGLDTISEVGTSEKKLPSNISTLKEGEHSRTAGKKTPEPVQHRYAEIRLDQQQISLGNPKAADLRSNAYNVMMVGDSSVGKTSFMKRAQSGKFSLDIPASVGLDSCMWTVVVDGKPVVLRLWDTAGQERFHSITRQTFHRAHAFLLMYDITSSDTCSAVSYWASCIQEGAAENVTVLLVGNKSDSAKRQVKTQDAEILAKGHNFEFMECSAATGENVVETLETLARMLSQKDDTREETLVLHKEPEQKKSSGCC